MTDWLHAWDMRYLLPPLTAGIMVALIAGPLGSLMVWRRLSYFGDTLSHSGLLGITLALTLHINITLGVCVIALFVALTLLMLQARVKVASDTLLGLLSHTTLALGLLLLAAKEEIRVDVLGFLYGDILAITWQDVLLISVGATLSLLIMCALWQPLLRITMDPDLAQVEGVSIGKVQVIYMMLFAIVVAISIKIVGVLLITALLIIPATGARLFAKSPEGMATWASIIGAISVLLGISFSHFYDVPAGPAIVVVAALILVLSGLSTKISRA